MNIIAIAKIERDNKVLGYNLFNLDTKQTIMTPLDTIHRVLKRKIENIQNIELKEDKLVGVNGSLDRLPSITVKGELQGEKSPFTIINQIEDIGYTVVDYKGTVAKIKKEQALEYAKQHGVSNGKIVTRDNKEFISSIIGEYTKLSRDSVEDYLQSDGLYKGQKLEGKRSLYPMLKSNKYIDVWDSKDSYQLFQYIPEKKCSRIKDVHFDNIKIYEEDLKKGVVYESHGLSFPYNFKRRLDYSDKKDMIVLRKALNNKEYLRAIQRILNEADEKVEEYIDSYKIDSRGNRKPRIKYGRKFGLPVNSFKQSGFNYDIINIQKKIGEPIEENSKMSDDIAETIMARLREAKIIIQYNITLEDKQIALVRHTSNKGIDYDVCADSSYYHQSKLEDIYYEADKYSNVIVKDNMICIAGLDGVYMYDMNKVSDCYKRTTAISNRNAKAKLLGEDYEEKITITGELQMLKGSGYLKIPEEVVRITPHSIDISQCKTLEFGPNIERIEPYSITTNYSNIGVQKIIINNDKCRKNILREIARVGYSIKYSDIEIQSNKKFTTNEIAVLAEEGISPTSLLVGNQPYKLDNNDLINYFNKVIQEDLNNFRVLNRKIKLLVRKIPARERRYSGVDSIGNILVSNEYDRFIRTLNKVISRLDNIEDISETDVWKKIKDGFNKVKEKQAQREMEIVDKIREYKNMGYENRTNIDIYSY